ncbi:BQ5605_C009g05449 [Microbotryum silenes-dioicae]|uniref:BQ5605_C009g05449 protein n=1 Tax=Microbotryum silenes-dioicae TaxID=796604 RepID=A0A2X0PFD3_9BASI|nr:BQ5605_C009g05449 [Microbotryum silenes-dioicae]
MAQGFKTKAPAKPKTKTTQKKLQNKDPKKGARTIPPKKQSLVAQAIVHRKNTSSHHTSLEKTIATQAISHGKLTINGGRAESAQEIMRGSSMLARLETMGRREWLYERRDCDMGVCVHYASCKVFLARWWPSGHINSDSESEIPDAGCGDAGRHGQCKPQGRSESRHHELST